ncbi:MAG: plastocyanin/azurin family copper-binding protein [Pseudomonadota bacterium]
MSTHVRLQFSTVFAAAVMALGAAAYASDDAPTSHVVQAKGVKFDPMIVYIEPGDKVSFERMPSHNVETIDEMVPEGQEKIFTELGDNIELAFDVEGIVVYKCTPHWGNRMGGIIVVGEPEDPGAIIDAYMASTEVVQENLPARGLLKRLRTDMEEKGLIESPAS